MNIVEHMMELYREGIDELMGAEKYAHKSKKATGNEEKMMYHNMAKQELGHAHELMKDGDSLFSGADAMDSLHMVWKSLRDHLCTWKKSIEAMLADS